MKKKEDKKDEPSETFDSYIELRWFIEMLLAEMDPLVPIHRLLQPLYFYFHVPNRFVQ